MDPEVRQLESMKLAAKLLCCAQQGPGDGGPFPSGPLDVETGEPADAWQEFLRLFFMMSNRIAEEVRLAGQIE